MRKHRTKEERRQAIAAYVRRFGPVTRNQIAAGLGITVTDVCRDVRELVGSGTLRQGDGKQDTSLSANNA